MQTIQKYLKQIITVLAVLIFCTACKTPSISSLDTFAWESVQLPTDSSVLDLSFIDSDHGWLVGSESTMLETLDGGKTWQPKPLALGEMEYRLTSISFDGKEGWVAGDPSILLHTTNGGQSWERVPLNPKLPGTPIIVTALGPGSVEMTTDQGAIYRTSDGAKNWTAMVLESFGITRNVRRSDDGKYVAVSSRGNFYSLWEPGRDLWEPHNRNNSRKLQSMGFDAEGQLWMLSRGGQLQFSSNGPLGNDVEWSKPFNPAPNSLGLMDLAYRTPNEVWAAGGSGLLLCSFDGGKTWQQDKTVAGIPSNFYKIVFITPEQGFITGRSGTLLKYVGSA